MRRILYIIIGVAFSLNSWGTVYTRPDSAQVVQLLSPATLKEMSTDQLVLFYARRFLGRPYVAHTLECRPDGEELVVNTRQLDCTTLVETVVALTLCARAGATTFGAYCDTLRLLRYRRGQLDGYPSRLHYFSDWIVDNSLKGIVNEVQTPNPPFSAVQQLSLNYMSTHPQSYEALRRHPDHVKEIARQEKTLTGSRFRYIPKTQVANTALLRQTIADGDIIAITTNKVGLDIAHLGFAVWQDDGLHLLNASMIHKKVVVEPMTLGQYLSKHPSHTGIRVIRLSEKTKPLKSKAIWNYPIS